MCQWWHSVYIFQGFPSAFGRLFLWLSWNKLGVSKNKMKTILFTCAFHLGISRLSNYSFWLCSVVEPSRCGEWLRWTQRLDAALKNPTKTALRVSTSSLQSPRHVDNAQFHQCKLTFMVGRTKVLTDSHTWPSPAYVTQPSPNCYTIHCI